MGLIWRIKETARRCKIKNIDRCLLRTPFGHMVACIKIENKWYIFDSVRNCPYLITNKKHMSISEIFVIKTHSGD